jgi:hypothetical protein
MSGDASTRSSGEQTTAADIDQSALAQLKHQLGELTGQELDLTDAQIINLITAIGARTDSDGSVTFRHIVGSRNATPRTRSTSGTNPTPSIGIWPVVVHQEQRARRLSSHRRTPQDTRGRSRHPHAAVPRPGTSPQRPPMSS